MYEDISEICKYKNQSKLDTSRQSHRKIEHILDSIRNKKKAGIIKFS